MTHKPNVFILNLLTLIMIQSTKISLAGVDMLMSGEREVIQKLLDKYYKKIQRHFKENISLEVHLKEYNREGNSKKYSLNAVVRGAMGKIESSYADWELHKAVHKVLDRLLEEIEHKYKGGKK